MAKTIDAHNLCNWRILGCDCNIHQNANHWQCGNCSFFEIHVCWFVYAISRQLDRREEWNTSILNSFGCEIRKIQGLPFDPILITDVPPFPLNWSTNLQWQVAHAFLFYSKHRVLPCIMLPHTTSWSWAYLIYIHHLEKLMQATEKIQTYNQTICIIELWYVMSNATCCTITHTHELSHNHWCCIAQPPCLSWAFIITCRQCEYNTHFVNQQQCVMDSWIVYLENW